MAANMTGGNSLPKNVSDFLFSTAERVGAMYANHWSQDVFATLIEGPITSPIEQLFLIACSALAKADMEELNPDPDLGADGVIEYPRGFYVSPQFKVGRYTVDFRLQQEGVGPADILTPVIVELDGHDFHDKDANQRAYEKARDRHLVKSGYRVLHFTGREVCADPFKVATEAMQLIGLFACLHPEQGYTARDPLMQGD